MTEAVVKAQNEAVTRLFTQVLRIDTQISHFTPLSKDMTLISFNAEPAAYRAGEQGRSLRVMTKNINELASVITHEVEMVSRAVARITGLVADYSENLRKSQSLQVANRMMQKNIEALEEGHEMQLRNQNAISAFEGRLKATNDNSAAELFPLILQLQQAFANIVEQIRIGEMVAFSVSTETARLVTDDENSARAAQSFQVLADKLRESCAKMREIVSDCGKRLEDVSSLLTMIREGEA